MKILYASAIINTIFSMVIYRKKQKLMKNEQMAWFKTGGHHIGIEMCRHNWKDC